MYHNQQARKNDPPLGRKNLASEERRIGMSTCELEQTVRGSPTGAQQRRYEQTERGEKPLHWQCRRMLQQDQMLIGSQCARPLRDRTVTRNPSTDTRIF